MNAEEILRRIGPSNERGCREWTGRRGPRGYTRIRWNGGRANVHRAVYEIHNGPVHRDIHVLHRCDNPPCCEPAHLFLGTNEDNIRDRTCKGRSFHPKGSAHPQTTRTESDIAAIKRMYRGGVGRGDLAEIFKMSRSNVNRILAGTLWRHTEPLDAAKAEGKEA